MAPRISLCIGWLLALNGCSLGADIQGRSSPVQAEHAPEAPAAPPAGDASQSPSDVSTVQPARERVIGPDALDELHTSACANGCTVVGQDPAQPGPATSGQVECSTVLDWQSQWVELASSLGTGAQLVTDSLGNAYFGGSFIGGQTLGPFAAQALPESIVGFVMKLGPDCTPLELKPLSGEARSQVDVHALAVDRDDNLIIAGMVLGTADFGLGPIATELENGEQGQFGFVLKLSPAGEPLWQRVLRAKYGATVLLDLGVSATGDIVLSGRSGLDVHWDGTPELQTSAWTAFFVSSLRANGEPGPIHKLAGGDVYGTIAVDPSGRVAINGFAFEAMPDPSGVFAAVEWSQTLYDHYLLMLDPSGALEWTRMVQQVEVDDLNGLLGFAIAFDSAGNLILEHGRTTFHDGGTITHRPQTLLKIAPDNSDLWSSTSLYEGQGVIQWMNDVAVDTHDNIVHVDEIVPDITLDGVSYAPRGARDHLVHKLDRDGVPVWTAQVGSDSDDVLWGLITDRDDAVWLGTSESNADYTHGTIAITKLAP